MSDILIFKAPYREKDNISNFTKRIFKYLKINFLLILNSLDLK